MVEWRHHNVQNQTTMKASEITKGDIFTLFKRKHAKVFTAALNAITLDEPKVYKGQILVQCFCHGKCRQLILSPDREIFHQSNS